MPGLAKGSRIDSPRATHIIPPAKGNAPLVATGLASTCLMPTGSGLTIPRLDGLATEQQLWEGEQTAARLARTFVEANIADADDWIIARQNPFAFLKRSLDRWLSRNGELVIREQFFLDLMLSTSLDRYFAGNGNAGEVSRVFLALEPDSAGYVVLGPTLRMLENVHPRLPVTFVHFFLGALNRWVRVYDFCCRQQKSYFVAIPVMWRRDRALRQTLVPLGLSAT